MIIKYSVTGARNLHFMADLYSTSYVRLYVVTCTPMTTSDFALDMQMSAENRLTTSSQKVINVSSPRTLVFMRRHL